MRKLATPTRPPVYFGQIRFLRWIMDSSVYVRVLYYSMYLPRQAGRRQGQNNQQLDRSVSLSRSVDVQHSRRTAASLHAYITPRFTGVVQWTTYLTRMGKKVVFLEATV